MWVQSFPVSSFDYLEHVGSADFLMGTRCSRTKNQFVRKLSGSFVYAEPYVTSAPVNTRNQPDDGRRLALQLFSHHGILLRGPVFSIFWCCAQWRKIVESFCFVHRVFFFFMAVVT